MLSTVAIALDDFKVMGSSFQTLGAATEKACLPELNLVLGTISREIDHLSWLGTFEGRTGQLGWLLCR